MGLKNVPCLDIGSVLSTDKIPILKIIFKKRVSLLL